MYVVDSTIWIYAVQNKKLYSVWLKEQIKQQTLTMNAVVYAEFSSGSTKKEQEIFDIVVERLPFFAIDQDVARQAAEYRKVHTQKGYKLKLPDVFVAAIAKTHDLVLVTNNLKHFPMQDIRIKVLGKK